MAVAKAQRNEKDKEAPPEAWTAAGKGNEASWKTVSWQGQRS